MTLGNCGKELVDFVPAGSVEAIADLGEFIN